MNVNPAMNQSDATTLTAPVEHKRFIVNVDTVVASILIFLHIALPLDLGVPGLNLGKTISPSIAASLFSFIIIWYTSRGKVFQGFRKPFAALFSVFILLLVVEVFQAPDAFIAMSHDLRMYFVFVVNYVIFVYLVERYGYRWMTRTILIGGCYAAVLAIGEIAVGRIPIYQKFAEAAMAAGVDTDSSSGIGVDFFRASGTMGNPIFMSILMGVCIPFVFELRSSVLRFLIIALLLGGAAATISRTIGLCLIVLMIGCSMVYTRKFWIAMGSIVGAFALVVVIAGDALTQEPHVMVWEERLGLASGSGSSGSDANVVLRANNSKMLIQQVTEHSNPLQVLFGHGSWTAGWIAKTEDGGFGTADDTPVTIVYEEGVIGIFLFYGVFIYSLWKSRRYARKTLHWYNGFALVACGFGTNFEVLSMFNIVAVASIAIVTASKIGGSSEPSLLLKEVDSIPETPSLEPAVSRE